MFEGKHISIPASSCCCTPQLTAPLDLACIAAPAPGSVVVQASAGVAGSTHCPASAPSCSRHEAAAAGRHRPTARRRSTAAPPARPGGGRRAPAAVSGSCGRCCRRIQCAVALHSYQQAGSAPRKRGELKPCARDIDCAIVVVRRPDEVQGKLVSSRDAQAGCKPRPGANAVGTLEPKSLCTSQAARVIATVLPRVQQRQATPPCRAGHREGHCRSAPLAAQRAAAQQFAFCLPAPRVCSRSVAWHAHSLCQQTIEDRPILPSTPVQGPTQAFLHRESMGRPGLSTAAPPEALTAAGGLVVPSPPPLGCSLPNQCRRPRSPLQALEAFPFQSLL